MTDLLLYRLVLLLLGWLRFCKVQVQCLLTCLFVCSWRENTALLLNLMSLWYTRLAVRAGQQMSACTGVSYYPKSLCFLPFSASVKLWQRYQNHPYPPLSARDSAHSPDIDRQVCISDVVIDNHKRILPCNAHRKLMSNRDMGQKPERICLEAGVSMYPCCVCTYSMCGSSHSSECVWLCVWRMRGTRCWLPTCGSGRHGMTHTWNGIKRTMMDWRWSTSPAAWCGGPTSFSITSMPICDTHTHRHRHCYHNRKNCKIRIILWQ